MDKSPETPQSLSAYGFSACGSQAMTYKSKKSTESLSEKKAKKDQTRKGLRGSQGEILRPDPATAMPDEMAVRSRTVASAWVFNVRNCHQSDLFVRNEYSEDPGIPILDVSLSHVAL